MKVYTRTGDDGGTALGNGQRVSKASARVAAYGDVDELNASLGVLAAEELPAEAATSIRKVQAALFEVGAALADPSGRFRPTAAVHDPAWIERWIDELDADLPPLRNFVLPGGARPAALAHAARCVCRRAERSLVGLDRTEEIERLLPFLNRLSDALFVLARWLNHRAGVPDVPWRAGA